MTHGLSFYSVNVMSARYCVHARVCVCVLAKRNNAFDFKKRAFPFVVDVSQRFQASMLGLSLLSGRPNVNASLSIPQTRGVAIKFDKMLLESRF